MPVDCLRRQLGLKHQLFLAVHAGETGRLCSTALELDRGDSSRLTNIPPVSPPGTRKAQRELLQAEHSLAPVVFCYKHQLQLQQRNILSKATVPAPPRGLLPTGPVKMVHFGVELQQPGHRSPASQRQQLHASALPTVFISSTCQLEHWRFLAVSFSLGASAQADPTAQLVNSYLQVINEIIYCLLQGFCQNTSKKQCSHYQQTYQLKTSLGNKSFRYCLLKSTFTGPHRWPRLILAQPRLSQVQRCPGQTLPKPLTWRYIQQQSHSA